MATGIKYKLDEWKQICTEKHKGLYTYDLITEYRDKEQYMYIYCTKHDLVFTQKANSHIRGATGCKKCKGEKIREIKMKKQEDVFNQIKKLHPHLDLSEAVYKGMLEPIKVICRNKDWYGNEHGVFNPTPANLLNGHECRKCADQRTAESNRTPLDVFLTRAKALHPEYDFSLVKQFKNIDEPIKVICHEVDEFGEEHGAFDTTPHRILNGNKCRKCRGLEKITVDIWKKRCEKIHSGKYDYSLVNFESVDDVVEIICPKHGKFEQNARRHMQGHGCQSCNNSLMENSVRSILIENNVEFIAHDRTTLGGLELDFYLPSKRIAIECQGSQHFLPKSFGAKCDLNELHRRLDEQKERDSRKVEKCKELGITLIYFLEKEYNRYLNENTDIPYFNDENELIKFIK